MSVAGAIALIRASVGAAIGALAVSTPPSAQAPSPDLVGVAIHIAVAADGRSVVTERLRAGGDPSAPRGRFQLLARPCADVGPITIRNASRSGVLRATSNDPWQALDDSAGIAGSMADVVLRYVVSRQPGGRDIPLVVPGHPIAHPAGVRGEPVTVRVTLSDSSDRVTFPRLERISRPGEWRGEFIAVPSFVTVRLAGAGNRPCTSPPQASDDGGLSWRFWLLVAILVVWVPTYQWWARRQPEGDGVS